MKTIPNKVKKLIDAVALPLLGGAPEADLTKAARKIRRILREADLPEDMEVRLVAKPVTVKGRPGVLRYVEIVDHP